MLCKRFKTEEIIQHLRTHEVNLTKGMSREHSAKAIGFAINRDQGSFRLEVKRKNMS